MSVLHYYASPGLSDGSHQTTLNKLKNILAKDTDILLQTEICYNIQAEKALTPEDKKKLEFLIGNPLGSDTISTTSALQPEQGGVIIEIGPRLNFCTAWSTNAVSICQSAGLTNISRIECSRRFHVVAKGSSISDEAKSAIVSSLHDRMTECRYMTRLESFDIQVNPGEVYEVDIMRHGREALVKANKDLGLAFDNWDLDYYTDLFTNKIKRNPTSVECFDLAQSNSEHSRHWFFKGRMVLDGQEKEQSLFKMVMSTQDTSNPNNVIKFSDNSSAIKGSTIKALYPYQPGSTGTPMIEKTLDRHIIFTAETHNFPTGVAPFSGATTGTGGRIRDVQSAGRGSHVVAGTAGYCFGNLHIPGYDLPWEDASFVYPSNMAHPLEVAVEASNGASDYGNKFGEPVLAGFARSFGMLVASEERREWVKPIMFSGGLGSLEEGHVTKDTPEIGMRVVKLGGPVYRIGVGGGAASSIQVQGDNVEALDFGAVQRGDAEMEQKLNRVVRACIEMGEGNPIRSIHDQGAGGNGNVLKEICEPAGAVIRTKAFQLGDPTLTTLELWGAEYQESNAILVKEEDEELLSNLCQRERCPVAFVGDITGDGKIRLEEEKVEQVNGMGDSDQSPAKKCRKVSYPVDLELEWVLGSMPRKVFNLDRTKRNLLPLNLPSNLKVVDALDRVLRLPSVASKRYLTNKVDRSVTGLVAQQQCVGPLHTPLADVAVTALSHFTTTGSATAIGEQPIKGLVDAACGARMAVAESLTNLVFARVSALKDVKCSGNWMWPAKLPGEGAALYEACQAMCSLMGELGIAVDGGKDSLSMAARVQGNTVKAPGALVISSYVGCPDITATVTPDLKAPDGQGSLLYVDLSSGHRRLGGSALAQCYSQLGDTSPDVDSAALLADAFNVTQDLIAAGHLVAGHDISDGGLITCLLEMAFAGNCRIDVTLSSDEEVSALEFLFAEELGLVLETSQADAQRVCQTFTDRGVPCHLIGHSHAEGPDSKISFSFNGTPLVDHSMTSLRDLWEATSFQLERLQTHPVCVEEEEAQLKHRKAPPYKLTFDPAPLGDSQLPTYRPKIAVIREEGSNGDREMLASFHMAGFEAWDINMQDLVTSTISLSDFRGVAFVGGFSFADVLGSAKGWSAAILYNPVVRSEFDRFRARPDTFSLGVCNGCQLMGLLGWVAPDENPPTQGDKAACKQGVLLDHNTSERYESRFVTVKIQDSPSIMLRGMADSILGIWVAHGEGKMRFASESLYASVLSSKLAPIRYVDDDGNPTIRYPLNPNGSPEGIAALCSADGRHLAMMPHPERCTLTWQWPWMPSDWHRDLQASPWLRMFQNAYQWCLKNQE